jgi:beta-lysine 5,6-aminomutase beta subunit
LESVRREVKGVMLRVDRTKIKAYGDRLDDGAVQLSFTLPVKASVEAKEVAKFFVKKMGLLNAKVSHMEAMGEQFTFFVVYANAKHSVNLKKIRVPKIKAPYMNYKELSAFMEKKIKEPIVVVGACTGDDAHTVGIDAIFNMKGFEMDYGLERYPLFKAINLRSQVDNVHLVRKAEELKADAILVSQIVTQRGSHVKNLKDLKNEIAKSKKLSPRVIKIVGGPRIDHPLAKKMGFDAGFGPGTKPSEVASFIVHEYLKRGHKCQG